ncbi:MAG: DUF177 domain-containing protein [Pseudomonadota bacterium]
MTREYEAHMKDMVFQTRQLQPARRYQIRYVPDAAELAKMARQLDVLNLKKLRFEGVLKADGKTDWRFDGQLGVTFFQPCVVTLDAVTTRIEESVTRRFLFDWEDPEESEFEMPDDDSSEPLGDQIDLHETLLEVLTLARPTYPRADGVELGEMVYTQPGTAAMTDTDAKPFAGLAALKDKLDKPN